MEPNIQPDPSLGRCRTDSGNGRYFGPPAAGPDHRRVAFGRPTTHNQRHHQESAFIQKENAGIQAFSFFLFGAIPSVSICVWLPHHAPWRALPVSGNSSQNQPSGASNGEQSIPPQIPWRSHHERDGVSTSRSDSRRPMSHEARYQQPSSFASRTTAVGGPEWASNEAPSFRPFDALGAIAQLSLTMTEAVLPQNDSCGLLRASELPEGGVLLTPAVFRWVSYTQYNKFPELYPLII